VQASVFVMPSHFKADFPVISKTCNRIHSGGPVLADLTDIPDLIA
jgi:hypothetical protein